MAYTGQISARQRIAAGSGALLAVAAVGFGLVTGLDLHVVRKLSETITAIAIPAPKPPPETVVPPEKPSKAASGKAAPANRHAKAAAVVAPKPKIPPPVPPPVAAASHAGTGNDASAGAAPIAGPGSGAGGTGDGTGAGGTGNGTGSGGTRPVWRSGRIDDDDYPATASRAKIGGEVETLFTILPTGRVTGCRVTRSSGDASLDATTCRLIEKRFRFRPATNANGEPIASQYGWRQSWWLERRR
ncbi:energy transducer TonB [Sphingopyxis macrogoltabida]|uniref:Energy transducer TonB n=2 Tax=Sphingopyxis macrogoltabida TaxID=33050 RepID=A0AAC8Z029_SPHMC|nr:energy transducer TonB [Sphingopyxis macrogoltabida]ALJ13143.1 TonB-like protein [Sphingopyxis macrogoltabida]AMU89391.1 energy transducer TonB [Sphingopyxis macrogoltabida]